MSTLINCESMKKLLLLILGCASLAFASEYESTFNAWLMDGCLEQADSVLQLWEKSSPDDPELHVARFNYYFNKAHHEEIYIDGGEASEGEWVVTGSDSTTVGRLGSRRVCNYSLYDLAIREIDRGILALPNRLDLRFGKASAGVMANNASDVYDAVLGILCQTEENGSWSFKDNLLSPDSARVIIADACYEYACGLWDEFANSGDSGYIDSIAGKYLSVFPEDIRMLNLIGVVRLHKDDYAGALKYLEEASRIRPDDDLVKLNIAIVSSETGDSVRAVDIFRELKDKAGVEDEIRAQATEFYDMLTTPLQVVTPYQFCFQWLAGFGYMVKVGSDEESVLASPEFINTVSLRRRGLRIPFKDSDISVEVVEIDGKKVFVWKFPEPKEAPLPLYEAFVPVGDSYVPYMLEKSVFVDWMLGTSNKKAHSSFGEAPRPKDAADFVRILKERGAFEGKITPGAFN